MQGVIVNANYRYGKAQVEDKLSSLAMPLSLIAYVATQCEDCV